MRRTNSDGGGGTIGSASSLVASQSFPSLSDTVLRQLGALMEEVKNREDSRGTSEKEIEHKYTSLMLAFKTDRITLDRRAEMQERHRDQAEENIAMEVARVKEALKIVTPYCTDLERVEQLQTANRHVEALHDAALWACTANEVCGAVKQENRLSKAVDIILRHVENLKQAYEKEKAEHEETRRILIENKIPPTVLKLVYQQFAAMTDTFYDSDEGRSLSRARLGSLPRKLSNTILEAESDDAIKDTSTGSNNSGGSSSRGDVGEGSGSSVRSMQRKSSNQAITQERRQSQAVAVAESESEDESLLLDASSDFERPPTPPVRKVTTTKQRQVEPEDPWLTKVVGWLRPTNQLLMRVRIAISIALGIAAVAVFVSTFIPDS